MELFPVLPLAVASVVEPAVESVVEPIIVLPEVEVPSAVSSVVTLKEVELVELEVVCTFSRLTPAWKFTWSYPEPTAVKTKKMSPTSRSRRPPLEAKEQLRATGLLELMRPVVQSGTGPDS